MKIRYFVCPFLILCLCSGCGHNEDIRMQEQTVVSMTKNPQYLESMQYPQTPYSKLNQEIQKAVHDWQGSFLLQLHAIHQYENNIYYEAFYNGDRYVSYALHMYHNTGKSQEDIKTFVYDKQEDAVLRIDNVLDEKQLQSLATYADAYFKKQDLQACNTNRYRSHISAAISNYERFVVTNDGLLFYFPANVLFDNETELFVRFDALQPPLAFEKETASTYVPYGDILNEPTKHIDPQKPMLALTFDDGPSNQYTASILDALKDNQASATFFVLGSNAARNPALLQRMVLEGNEIGNHTYSHKQLTTLSKGRIEEEIVATQESIFNITHLYPDLIRPPYGSKNDMVLQCAQGKQLVAWTMDTQDWKYRDAKRIVSYVEENVKDGDIILMHDVYATTAQAATILIPLLKDLGYQLVTVSELYAYHPNGL